MALTQIIVTATYKNSDGSPAAGVVTFTPSASLIQAGVGIVTVAPKSVFILFGSMSVTLYADDDTGTTPTDQGYTVVENFGPEPVEYSIVIPHTAPGGTIDLSTLDHVSVDAIPRFGTSVTDEQFVRSQRLDQFATPSGAVAFGGQRISGLGAPATNTDAAQALGSVLGAKFYYPTTAANYTIGSSTLAAIDTTNLTVSFTAIGTQVLVELEVTSAWYTAPTAGDAIGFALFAHGTSTQVGTSVTAVQATSTSTAGVHCRVRVLVTGLTAGTAYQYDWAWARTGSATPLISILATSASTFTNAQAGGAVMRVLAA